MATFYPEIEPYEHGMLDVGDGNLVYWELCGNPAGKPAVVLHGGPGSGCTPWWRRYFDPAVNNQCREPQAEWVVDKERRNFCDFHHLSDRPAVRKAGRGFRSRSPSQRRNTNLTVCVRLPAVSRAK